MSDLHVISLIDTALYNIGRRHDGDDTRLLIAEDALEAAKARLATVAPKRYRIIAHTASGLDQYIENPNGPWVRAFDVFGPDTTDTKYCDLCKHSYPLPAYSSHYCPKDIC